MNTSRVRLAVKSVVVILTAQNAASKQKSELRKHMTKRKILTYKEATKIKPGIPICNAGYANCPAYDSNHYHCGRCGGVTGMFGHYAGEDVPFYCERDDVELIPQ